MNVSSEIIALLAVTILLYVRPMVLVNFSNTLLGKALLIFIVVAASLQSTVSGILVALAIVVLAEMNYEGMESGSDSTVDETSSKKDQAYSQFDNIVELGKKHCRDGKNDKQPALFVDSEGKEVPLDEIKKMELRIFVYTINDVSDYPILNLDNIVDGIITDKPKIFLRNSY